MLTEGGTRADMPEPTAPAGYEMSGWKDASGNDVEGLPFDAYPNWQHRVLRAVECP